MLVSVKKRLSNTYYYYNYYYCMLQKINILSRTYSFHHSRHVLVLLHALVHFATRTFCYACICHSYVLIVSKLHDVIASHTYFVCMCAFSIPVLTLSTLHTRVSTQLNKLNNCTLLITPNAYTHLYCLYLRRDINVSLMKTQYATVPYIGFAR